MLTLILTLTIFLTLTATPLTSDPSDAVNDGHAPFSPPPLVSRQADSLPAAAPPSGSRRSLRMAAPCAPLVGVWIMTD